MKIKINHSLLVKRTPTTFFDIFDDGIFSKLSIFFTATVLEWKPLLKQDKYKEIIVNSLAFLVKEKRIEVYGFVIMSNHIHIIWRIMNEHKLA